MVSFSLLFVSFATVVFCFYLLSWQKEGVKTFNLNFNFFYNLYNKLELLETSTLKVYIQASQTVDRFKKLTVFSLTWIYLISV